MLSINEAEVKEAIVQKVADEILRQGELSQIIEKQVKLRLDKIFADCAEKQIQEAIDSAIKEGFEREYQRITSWGKADGEKTSISKELAKLIDGYWNNKVNANSGKSTDDSYGSITRAEYLMAKICADDFSKIMQNNVKNVTGALKDGLRNQLAKQMDGILDGLFRIKSLQDQGVVKKPY